MKLDLTEIMNKRRETLEFDYTLMPDGSEGYALFPDGEELVRPADVHARAFDANGYVRLDFDVDALLRCRCTRCLDEVEVPLSVSFRRYAGQSANAAYGAEDDEESGEDVLEINDSAVEADADVMEELALAAPDIVLCSDDCPGLCPRCGKKIGRDCACAPEKEEITIDPRMEKFKKLLDSMDE